MIDIVKWVISIAFALPVVSLVCLFFIVRLVVKNKRKAILRTIDLSTFFFIVSVHFHLVSIFEQSYFSYIILGIVGLMCIVYYIENKKTKQPTLKKVSKKVWRFSFLFFFISYIVLTIYGITSGVIENLFI